MFYFNADITLSDTYRKRPLQGDTCRPLLWFEDIAPRSGLIHIEKGEKLEMTETYKNRRIGIYFYDKEIIRKLFVGKIFSLAEGSLNIGKGVITSLIGIGNNPHLE